MDQEDKENEINKLDWEVSQLRDDLEALKSRFASYQEQQTRSKVPSWWPDLARDFEFEAISGSFHEAAGVGFIKSSTE